MIPESGRKKDSKMCVPRVGGGDPVNRVFALVELLCSPRRRG